MEIDGISKMMLAKCWGIKKVKYLICYDISDNSCRRKVVKYLEAMARRLQYSVFMADCSSSKIEDAKNSLWLLVNGVEGSYITIAPLCQTCADKIMQYGKERESYESCVIL